jgi:hypothetical protein
MLDQGFVLRKVLTDSFVLKPELFDNTQKLNVDLGVRFGTIPKEKMITGQFHVTYRSGDNVFVSLQVTLHFLPGDALWQHLLSQPVHEKILPRDVALFLGIITMDTCRGVLHTCTEGTLVHNFHLPLLDLNSAIPSDVKLTM